LAPDGEGEGDRGESYDRRQTAIKWTLVTCFGYLGYRNARFGRIEAHEAVTAFGREKLLQAKEICEERGFELLHALTDSIWIRKKDLREEVSTLPEDQRGVCVTMNLEGIYDGCLSFEGNPKPVATAFGL
jgi:DNA polymerase-2